jgi:(1->4)-alpha-D-glucan 1-alpha-D-glucosylmutase
LEDTAFYTYPRLISLNEVGNRADRFGVSVAELHTENERRQRTFPLGMTASSTHDSKRGEDARARISVLSEIPELWTEHVLALRACADRYRTEVDEDPTPSGTDEYLLYQTLLGAWPWDAQTPDEAFVARIEAFMLKAARESQVHTSWVNPDPAYEDALQQFVRTALDVSRPNPFLEDFAALREIVAHAGAINALAQQLLKLTAPGVPDIYQGTELWDQSLVDPDNRRPVDYTRRARLLRGLERRRAGRRLATDLLETKADGRVKLYLTSRMLACRAAYPDLFARGDYVPLAAEGAAADHVVAFARRDAENKFITVVPRLVVGLVGKELRDPVGPEVWCDTRLLLAEAEPGTRYRHVFSGETITVPAGDDGAGLLIADVFAAFPFALLERTSLA